MMRRWIPGTFLLGLLCIPNSAWPAIPLPLVGTVAETMDGGRYTYIRVTTDTADYWVAATHLDAKVGDPVTVRDGTTMENFASPTLGRTFDRILFTETVQVGTEPAEQSPALPPGHPPVSPSGARNRPPAAGFSGEVIETMDTGGYTYVRVRTSDKTVWAATTRFDVKVGDRVVVPSGMVMTNFESPTLRRTFDTLYFVDSITRENRSASSPPTDPADLSAPMAPPAGGLSIADVYRRRHELAGTEITVRGRVVKCTERVMGRNWIHLEDGSGDGDQAEITVTSSETARVGDPITVRGQLSVDEDFGYDYKYPVLIKDARLIPE